MAPVERLGRESGRKSAILAGLRRLETDLHLRGVRQSERAAENLLSPLRELDDVSRIPPNGTLQTVRAARELARTSRRIEEKEIVLSSPCILHKSTRHFVLDDDKRSVLAWARLERRENFREWQNEKL
jgi:hypothetical protein